MRLFATQFGLTLDTTQRPIQWVQRDSVLGEH